MIQIKAPDGAVVQFPDGTDDSVITDVMAKNYPAPAPDLASVGADAQRQLVQQPGVMDAVNTRDTAALAGPAAEPTMIDRMHAAIFGPSTPAAPVDPNARGAMGVVDQGVRGVAQGVAQMAGAPFDLAGLAKSLQRGGLQKLGVPEGIADAVSSANPIVNAMERGQKYLGGDALKGYLDSLNRGTADAIGVQRPVEDPQGVGERVANRVGQEVGAMAIPVGGAVKAGASMGVDAARELPALARMFVEPAAIDAGKFVSKEAGTAVAAGTGAAAANEIANAAGADKHGGAYAAADLVGALGGAGVLGAARMAGKPIKDIAQAVTNRDGFSNDVVKNNVVDRILNNTENLPKTEGKAIDTTPLVEAITGGKRVDATIPGFKDSIADRTGDPGLATLEYGRQSGPNAGEFVARRGDNTKAVDNAMNANAPDGNPAALREELNLERDRRLTDAGTHTANAQDEFDRATQALQPAMTGEGRGANIRGALEGASGEARRILQDAWAPLNNSAEHVDMAPLADRFGGISRDLSTAERNRFNPAEAGIPRQLSGEREVTPAVRDANGTVTTPAVTEPITQPLREVTGLRSALTDASREAMTAGNTNEARIINQHVDALDHYLDRAVPEASRQEYDAARAATVDFHDRFTRPQTAIAQTLDRREGLYSQPDSAVAGKFVQADKGKISDFQALMRETGHDDRTVSAVRDQILADVRDRGLLDSPDQLREYLGRYNTVLSDRRFAGVRDQLDNAAGLRRSLDDATTAQGGLTRELGTAEKPGTSAVGKYLAYGDERSQDALKTVISSKNPGAAMDDMLRFVNDAPEAVNGARKSFWDLMQSKTRSNGETTKTVDGAQPWMPNKLKNFLDDPAHQAVAERLYRDEPEQLSNIRKISDELQGVDLRARGKANNTSGTAQGVSNVLTPETIQSRFYAYKRGQTSLGFMLTALGSVAARRLVRGVQGEAMEKLLDKALLDPDLAAQLLKEHNPANRAALARTAKGYLGAEAAQVTDLLNEPEDPTKAAIMRKDGKDGR